MPVLGERMAEQGELDVAFIKQESVESKLLNRVFAVTRKQSHIKELAMSRQSSQAFNS